VQAQTILTNHTFSDAETCQSNNLQC